MLQIIVGVLGTLCVVLILAVICLVAFYGKTVKNIKESLVDFEKMLVVIKNQLANMPPTNLAQNIIHLGLKDGRVTTGLAPATLNIRPEDFQVRADKLREKLFDGLETEKHPSISTRAYCILKYAGVDEMLDGGSWTEVKKTLVRLLSNGDNDAAKRFLETLADSISVATVPVEPEPAK